MNIYSITSTEIAIQQHRHNYQPFHLNFEREFLPLFHNFEDIFCFCSKIKQHFHWETENEDPVIEKKHQNTSYLLHINWTHLWWRTWSKNSFNTTNKSTESSAIPWGQTVCRHHRETASSYCRQTCWFRIHLARYIMQQSNDSEQLHVKNCWCLIVWLLVILQKDFKNAKLKRIRREKEIRSYVNVFYSPKRSKSLDFFKTDQVFHNSLQNKLIHLNSLLKFK